MGTVIQAGHIFSGGTIISIPPAGGDSTLYYLVSSHLPSDYAVYLYDSSGNELVRIPKPNDASDSWGNNIGTNDTKIAITDNNGNGALYIYDMDGSNMVKVTSSDASGNDRFGSQLEINSTKIIVGAPYAGPTHQQGSVYVYDLDGTNEVKITASDGAYGDGLSGWSSLAVSESKIFVGASDHDNKRGALYIYDMDGSNEVKVQPSDSAEGDEFSYVVAASETKVVATAAANGDHGAAYIFDHDGTNEVKIEPSVDSRNNAFGGASAAINDTHVVISDRAFNGQRGAIYIYNIDGTNEVRIEHPSHFAPYDFFGYNLAMSSSKVFTCPPNDDDGGSSTGNVYEYNLDGTGERTLPTPSTFAAGSRFGQGLYIYDSSLVPSAPTFIAPSTASSTVANKIFMWSSDAASYQNGTGRSDVGGVVMTDGDFSNPTTIQLDSPQMVVGGEGKVVTIAQFGEIKVYDESTGQLEQTFNDSYLDSAKATGTLWGTANDAVIGAGKIFINSHEQNPNGVGSIIVVDLLDRNVATYLITPTLGNYSRLTSPAYGGIKFIDGRIYASTEQWSAPHRGIYHFAVDGSDQQFIPTTHEQSWVKWGDNFVINSGYHDIQVIDSSGTVLHTLSKPADYSFGQDLGVTSTGKLVVQKHITNNPVTFLVYLYDEGFTNEIEINGANQPNGPESSWGYGTVENSGGFEVFGEYILVSAKDADNNGITNCGAVYRYNDSGVLQNIFYGTVANQRIGTNISVGTAT